MQTLRWAIIGAGRFGKVHAEVLQQMPGVELAAVCSRTKEKAEAAAAELGVSWAATDFRHVLASDAVDVVTIATHWEEHFETARAALESGKHVLLEKPMAPTAEECRTLVETARRAKGVFMVGHVCRFDPRAAAVKRAVESGRIGRIVSMHARRNLPVAPGPLRLDRISPLMGDGVHDADLMMWLLGRAPTRVYARHVRVDRFRFPDVGWAMLEFGELSGDRGEPRDGAIGVVETNWRLPANAPTTIDAVMQIVGTEGQITLDCGHAGVAILDGAGLHYPDTAYWPDLHGRRVGALSYELEYFARCIREGRRPEIITPEESARAAAVLETADRSAEQGVPLTFDEVF